MLPQSDRKYELKSAIIKLKSAKPVLGSDIESTVYFDEFGEKFCNITDTKLKYKNTEIVTRSISITRNDYTYTWNPEKKSGTKSINKGNLNPMHIDFMAMDAQAMKDNGIVRKGESEWLGKTCEVYVMDNPMIEMYGRYEVWNKIPLKYSTRIGESSIEMFATEVMENAVIENSVFELPDSIEFIDAVNPLASPSAPSVSDSLPNLSSQGK